MPSYGVGGVGHRPLEGAGKEGRGNRFNGRDHCPGHRKLGSGMVGEVAWWWWWWWWWVSIARGEGGRGGVGGYARSINVLEH